MSENNRIAQSKNPIGVFDSGLGGLTVLSAIHTLLPQEDLIYFGDTARVPYGSKSKDTVIRYSLEIADFLHNKNVKTIVVACNTASSHALEALQEKMDIPVLGVVQPGVNALGEYIEKHGTTQEAPLNKVALIATRSTVRSLAYEKTLAKKFPQVQLLSRACPLFVPLIEEGMLDKNFTEMIVREYLDELDREDIRHVILGCTHYPLLKKTISRMYPHFQLIDSSIETAKTLKKLLEEKKMLQQNAENKSGSIRLYVSDITESLQDLSMLFFGNAIDSVEKINLGW